MNMHDDNWTKIKKGDFKICISYLVIDFKLDTFLIFRHANDGAFFDDNNPRQSEEIIMMQATTTW